MDWITASKIVLAFGLLLLASRADWRTREASDAYWVALGVAGMAFLAAQIHLDAADPTYYLILFPIAVLFLDIFWDRRGVLEDGVNLVPLLLYVAAFATLAWLVLEHHADLYLWELMLVPIMFLLFILFYQFDLIKGGADAKALIALSIMFPMYPTGDGFPLIALPTEMSDFLLPFPLLILFNAALLTLAVPLAMLALNLARRDVRFPAMLFGYRMSIDDAKNKFVWPMERIVDGERRMNYFPRSSDDAANGLMELEEAGVDSTWVTPKVPFLVPITISLLVSTFIGNPFFLLFQ
jgi:preflagellin peptidase FlaK